MPRKKKAPEETPMIEAEPGVADATPAVEEEPAVEAPAEDEAPEASEDEVDAEAMYNDYAHGVSINAIADKMHLDSQTVRAAVESVEKKRVA